jgi:hypothetical protein
VTYPRHRITGEHKHRFLPIGDPIVPVIAPLAVSFSDQVLCMLSILAAHLYFSTQAATSEAMTAFITAVIAITSKHVPAHPDDVHEASRIFRPVTDKILARVMLCASDQRILEKIKRLRASPVTIQIDTVTILLHHFLNYVVSCPGLTLFLLHAEFHNRFAPVDYRAVTTRVV